MELGDALTGMGEELARFGGRLSKKLELPEKGCHPMSS